MFSFLRTHAGAQVQYATWHEHVALVIDCHTVLLHASTRLPPPPPPLAPPLSASCNLLQTFCLLLSLGRFMRGCNPYAHCLLGSTPRSGAISQLTLPACTPCHCALTLTCCYHLLPCSATGPPLPPPRPPCLPSPQKVPALWLIRTGTAKLTVSCNRCHY